MSVGVGGIEGELFAEGGAVHLQGAGEQGGFVFIAGEEGGEESVFEFVVKRVIAGGVAVVVVSGEPGVEPLMESLVDEIGRGGKWVTEFAREVGRMEDVAGGGADGVFEDVAEFADVAGPGVIFEEGEGFCG